MSKRVLHGVKAIIPGKSSVVDILIEDGIITGMEKSEERASLTAVPGFIDTHIHGFAGCGTEDASEQSILKMSKELLKHGITSFFPTIYTDTLERIENDIAAIRKAKGKEEGARIMGIHLEGPFISPKRIGAQNPEGQRNPDVKLFKHFIEISGGLLKALTSCLKRPRKTGLSSLPGTPMHVLRI